MDILLVRIGAAKPREVVLGASRVEVGEAVASEFAFAGVGLAARHFALERAGEGWKIVDLGSAAGTLVNGSFVVQKLLKRGDRIEAGTAKFEIVTRQDPPGSTPASKAPTERAPQQGSAASAPAAPLPKPAVAPVAAGQFHDILFPERDAAPPAEPPRREPGSTSSGIHRAAARRRARRYVTSVVLVVVALIAAAIFVVPELSRRRSGKPLDLANERLQLASALRGARDFDRARAILSELRLSGGGVNPNQIEAEIDALEREQTRMKNSEEIARQFLAETAGDPKTRLERIALAQRDYADLPAAVNLAIAARATQRAIRAVKSRGDRPIVERLESAKSRALSGEYGAALAIYSELGRSELITDRYLATHGAAMAEAGADVVGRSILTQMTEALAKEDVLGASIAADEERIAGLRGTRLASEIEQVADVVAVKLAGMPNRGSLVPLPPVKSGSAEAAGATGAVTEKEREAASGATSGATSDAASEATAKTTPSVKDPLSGIDRQLVREADALYSSGDVEGAQALLERALASASAAAKPVFEQRLERSRRATGFLSTLLGKLTESTKAVAAVPVKAKDGSTGNVVGVSHGMLVLKNAEGVESEFLPADLDPASCLALARKLTWTSAESIDRASFALIVGDAKDIDAALARAAEDGNNKHLVDSLVALWRGLDTVPEWGFFRVDGNWITFKEREERLYAKQVHDAVAKLDRGDKAWDEGITLLNELLPVAPKPIAEELAKRREKMLAALLKQPEWKALESLEAERVKLEEARKHALELIFDEVKYFYPYSTPAVPPDIANLYHEVQREVDDRVEKVRAIWGGEHGEAPKGVALSAQFQKLVKMLLGERPLLAICDPMRTFDEPTAARVELLPANVDHMSIRDIAADMSERWRLDQDRQVLALNLKITTSATAADLEQIRVTNEYRRMMGVRALAANEKLVRAARGHSEWMSRTGKFSHTNDEDPQMASPFQRMAAQGYAGGGGENLALNGGGPMGAHDGWKHSSGHHRNLLWESHTELGVSGVGNYWTQNFGGGTEYNGNLEAEGN